MRAIWVRLARWAPPILITNRLVPWITLLLAALGATWALFQYSDSVAIQRSNTTLTIHRQFVSVFPNGAQEITGQSEEALVVQIFKVRCDIYRAAMADGVLPPDERLHPCETITLADQPLLDEIAENAPQALRDQVLMALETVVLTNAVPARRMMTYFRSLQVCVEGHQCDLAITSELFASDIVAFLNLTCDLAERDAEFARQGDMLGRFARSLLSEETIPRTGVVA